MERSIAFYASRLGLHLVNRDEQRAAFATAEKTLPLLHVTQDRSAKFPPRDAAGLFHAALLLPTRSASGNWVRQAADAGVKFDGFSDHGVKIPTGSPCELLHYIKHKAERKEKPAAGTT